SAVGAEEDGSLDRCCDGAADEAVEPVVVRLLRPGLPLIDGSPAALGLYEVLGRDLFGEHAVGVRSVTEDRQTAAIPHRDSESGVRERFPPVGVIDHVPDRSLAMDTRNPPVETDAVAGAPLVFAERIA